MNWDLILEIAGFLIGLLYLWWEYHANAKLWLASIVMPTISMWIYFRKGLYADFTINIYYFVMAIYGYIAWTWRSRRPADVPSKSEKDEAPALKITHMKATAWAGCLLVLAALWWGIFYLLHNFTDSKVPVYDAFTTALSIVATWMLARKYIEQWLAWILVDAVCVGLYCYKEIYLYATLYAIYTVIAVAGYRKWQKLMLKQQ